MSSTQTLRDRYNATFDVTEVDTVTHTTIAEAQLEANGFDLDWIRDENRNAYRHAQAVEDGVESLAAIENPDDPSGTIRMTPIHAMVWIGELTGQISGGAWENYWHRDNGVPRDGWESLVNLDVVVDPDADGVEIDGPVPHTNLDVTGKMMDLDAQVGRIAYFMSAVDMPDDRDDVRDLLEDFDAVL